MKYRSKKRYGFLILLLIVGIGIGYALLSTTVKITGKSSIGKSSWDIVFYNIYVSEGSVVAVEEPTITNDTTIDFEVDLELPGDYYEFTTDIFNNGTIDAMIESIEKIPDLTDEQKKYFNYTVEYQNGEGITSKQLVKSGSFVRVIVRVEYKTDLTASDLPGADESLSLGFAVNYVQSDGTGNEVTTNGVLNKAAFTMVSGDLDTPGSEFCLGDECFYVIGDYSDDMVAVFSKYNLYVGNKTTYLDENTVEYEPLENPTGLQNPLAIGFDAKEYKLPFYGGIAFSKSGKTSYYESDIKVFVDNYANYIYDLGYPSYYHGIPYESDLEYFVCGSYDAVCSYSEYPWIYTTTYWLADYYESVDVATSGMAVMLNTGSIGYSAPDTEGGIGLRTGFVFEKSVLTN